MEKMFSVFLIFTFFSPLTTNFLFPPPPPEPGIPCRIYTRNGSFKVIISGLQTISRFYYSILLKSSLHLRMIIKYLNNKMLKNENGSLGYKTVEHNIWYP